MNVTLVKDTLRCLEGSPKQYRRALVQGLVAGLMAASGREWLPVWRDIMEFWQPEFGHDDPMGWDTYVILTNDRGTYFLDRRYRLLGPEDQTKLAPVLFTAAVETEYCYSTMCRPNWVMDGETFTAYWRY